MNGAPSDRNPVEQLAEEFLERIRRGEDPAVSEYIDRHPQHADEIRELFPMMVDLERAIPDTDDGTQARQEVADLAQIGDYRIIREIGRGGMGIVYEAEQQSLGRHVALKILPTQSSHEMLSVERFRREARAAARLHHSNIVPVFEVGQEGSTIYYAMQFIQGHPFDSVIRELRSRVAEGAESGETPDLLSPFTGSWKVGGTTRRHHPANEATEVFQRTESVGGGQSDRGTTSNVELPDEPPSSPSASSEPNYRDYFQRVAEIGKQVAEALSYAHQRGTIHRDVKPSNLLLDTNGVVWVTDFGMAKTDAAPLTRTGDILGTLHYMAPERFQGKCDARADIYAAGLTLYELLTLRPAFATSDRLQLVELIANQNPTRPRSLQPRIPRDLETIVLKAIDKDPARRYQSSEELGEDLECFLADRPIKTRRARLGERFVRWTRRNPVLSGLSTAVALLLCLGLVASIISAIVLKRSTDRAIQAEQVAVEKTDELLQQSYVNWVNLAYLEFRNDNVARAKEYLENCEPDQRGWEWHFVARQCEVALRSWRESGHSVNCLDFSPDDKWIAIGTGNFLNRRGPPGDLVVRDVLTGEVKFRRSGIANGVTAVSYSPAGHLIATANGGQLTVWDAETGEERFTQMGDADELLCLEFSPDGKQLAGGFGRFNSRQTGYVKIWDAATGKQVGPTIPGSAGGVWDLAFNESGTRIALTSAGQVEIWNVAARELVTRLQAGTGFIYAVAYHPKGEYLAAGGLDRKIRLWDTETHQLVRTYAGHTGFVRGIEFSNDGRRIISASEDKSVRLWSLDSERELATLRGHAHFVNCVAFSSNGRIVASGSLDQTAKVWFATSEPQLVYRGHAAEGHVRALAFHPTDAGLASGSLRFAGPTGRLHYWHPATGRRLLEFPQRVDEVSSVAFRHDGARLVAGHVDGVVSVWNTETAELIARLEAHVQEVHDVAYSPDGRLLASVGQDTSLNLWNADSGTLLWTKVAHEAYITSVEFSPSGKAVATGSEDGTVAIWDAATLKNLLTLRHRGGEVRGLAYSPDGRHLVSTGGVDHRRGDVVVWDAKDGSLVAELSGHTDIVYDVDFSPDGQRFATASDDRTIKLWDAISQREVFTIRGHTGGVLSVEFSPDGQMLASGGVDRAVRVWSLHPADAQIHFQRDAVAEYAKGRQFLEQRRWQQAVSAFDRSSRLGLDQSNLRLDFAEALQAQSDTVAAESQIQRAVDSAPNNQRQLASLAIELERRGHHEESQQVMNRAVRLAPGDLQVLSAAGRLFAANGQTVEAVSSFDKAVGGKSTSTDRAPGWWQTGWWSAELPPDAATWEQLSERGSWPVLDFVAPNAGKREKDVQIKWIPIRTDGDGYTGIRSTAMDASIAAVQHVFCQAQREVAFNLGLEDQARVWLNGTLVFERTRARKTESSIGVTLRKGWNTVLVSLQNPAGPSGVYFQISDHARDRARAAARLGNYSQVLKIWSSASGSESNDALLLGIVGDALARKGRWGESARVFEQLVKRQPARNRNWAALGPLLVYSGRIDRYREFRQDLLRIHGRANNPIAAERTSKASLLTPLARADAALPHQLASYAVEAGANHSLLPYLLFARGLSAYRIGDFPSAIDYLEQSIAGNRSRWPYLDVVAQLFASMSQYQIGEHETADQIFEQANRLFIEELPAADSEDFGPDWLDWLICEIARKEARQLIMKDNL